LVLNNWYRIKFSNIRPGTYVCLELVYVTSTDSNVVSSSIIVTSGGFDNFGGISAIKLAQIFAKS